MAFCLCGHAQPLPPGAPATNAHAYRVQGVIKSLPEDGKSAVIRHDEIPNYMAAMTMQFTVRDTNALRRIAVGDRVSFQLLVTENESWIEGLEVLGKEPTTVAAAPNPGLQPTVSPLRVGDVLPDIVLTNQDGRTIEFKQFRGQALAFTFIFTRCPLPEYCPRMSTQFKAAAGVLVARTNGPVNWHLVSISFDPEFDSPEVLKAYSSHYGRDPAHWDFATASRSQLDGLERMCGLLAQKNGGGFDHNLRTVVADSQGRVVKIFIGNQWTGEELADEMVGAAKTN